MNESEPPLLDSEGMIQMYLGDYIVGDREYNSYDELENDYDLHKGIAQRIPMSESRYIEVSNSIDTSYQWFLISYNISGG